MLNRITEPVYQDQETDKRKPVIPELLETRRDPMMDLVPKDSRVVVEVGSQMGWWVRRAVPHLPPKCKVYCVDPWSDDPEDVRQWHDGKTNLHQWCVNVEEWLGSRVTGLKGTSEEVVPQFDQLIDFIFIDGEHSCEGLTRDLELWVPKVRSGGVVVGHDWDGIWRKGVRRAVHDFFDISEVEIAPVYWACRGRELTNCWIWRK